MKVITYVNGVLTVINEDMFFSEVYAKPSFIVADEFYYEPTLKLTQGRELSVQECNDAEAYIDTFVFPKVVVYNPQAVHCVDKWGNYLGFKLLGLGEIEVPNAPSELRQGITWDFDTKEWYESVLVDERDGRLIGTAINTAIDYSVYVRASLVNTNFCIESQTYNFDTKVFDIDIEVVRKKKLAKINFAFTQVINEAIGFVGFGEMSSWDKQETEARAWVVDNNTITPFIDALLVGRGMNETKDALVQKIIVKADAYKTFYGQMLGKLHAKQKLIEEAETLEVLKAIEW